MSCAPIYDQIVCFGDSLTAQAVPSGFVSRLQALYDRKLEVVCRGFSGYTTREAALLAPRLFVPTQSLQGRIALVILWFGANDAAVEGHRQHNPVSKYLEEIQSIVQSIHQSVQNLSSRGDGQSSEKAKTRVLVLTPPPVLDNASLVISRSASVTKHYAQCLEQLQLESELSRDLSVKKVDIHALFTEHAASMSAGGLQALLQADGLHISEKGYDVVFEALFKAIGVHFPEIASSQLPMVIPRWSFLDRDAEDLPDQLRISTKDDEDELSFKLKRMEQ